MLAGGGGEKDILLTLLNWHLPNTYQHGGRLHVFSAAIANTQPIPERVHDD